jgi:RNA polymerase sigma-70 factor (ECF subfamily)
MMANSFRIAPPAARPEPAAVVLTGPWGAQGHLQEAMRGNRRAFEMLYREHVGGVYGLCLRLTGQREAAEDCTQETFVAAWRSLREFEARSSFATWLHRIAVNKVLTRRTGLAAKLEQLAADLPADDQPDAASADAMPALDLERAIQALPDGARHVLVLVGIYGHSHEEAGALLGIAAGTCRAHLHRARRLLGDHMGLDEDSR